MDDFYERKARLAELAADFWLADGDPDRGLQWLVKASECREKALKMREEA